MGQVIQIGMDVSDVKSGSAELIAALQGQASSIQNVFLKLAEVNKQGELSKQVFQGITETGDKVEATLKKVATGWEVVASKVKLATDAMKKAQAEQEAAAEKARSSAGEKAVLGAFDLDKLDSGQAGKVESAVQRIKTSLADGGVSIDRFQEILAAVKADPNKIIPDLTRQEQKLASSVRSIVSSLGKVTEAQNATAAGKQRGAAGEAAISGAFDLSDLTAKQAAQIESSMQKIRASLATGGVSMERFREILARVKADPKQLIPDMTAAEQKLAASVRSMMDTLGLIPKKVDDTSRVFISLAGVMRLLEAQIIKRIFRSLETEILGAITAAQQFTIQVAEIRSISQGAQLSSKEWGEQITALSSAFGRTQADVAEGVFQTLSNQVAKGADSFKFMNTALGLSQATFSTATESATLLAGAMKSFQLPAEDAERVSAILFKTMQMGHVRAKDMSDTFAKIGMTAKDSGLKLEELSAAVVTLTSRGIKFGDASNLIQGILSKLLKPSEEMKKVFAEWGVSSGQAAIATFGFSGVLGKLDAEAQKGNAHMGELLGQFKAIRAQMGLTGPAFADFQSSLQKVGDAQKEFANAKQEGANSPGQRAATQMTQLRNFFEQDFGEKFLSGMLRIADAAGGAVNAIKGLVIGVQAATAAFVLFKTVQIANLPIMAANITLTGAWSTVAKVFTVDMTASTGALAAFQIESLGVVASLALLASAFAVGAAVGYFLFIREGTKDLQALAAAAKQFTDDQEKQNKGARDREAGRFTADVESTKKSYGDRYRVVLQYATSVSREATKMKEESQKQLRAITEDLKVSAGTYFGNLRTQMQKFTEAISEAKRLVKGSLKESEDLARRGENQVFTEKLKYASPGTQDPITGYIVGNQKVELLKQRIVQLAAKAREEFGKGTKESVEEGRKLFNDVEKMKSQLFEADTAKQRSKFEFDVKQGTQTPTSYDSLGRPRYEFTVKTAELERDINATTKERLALEERFRAQQEARQAAAQKDVDAERERIRALQQQFTLLEKIDVFDHLGKLKKEYQGEGGVQKALAEFDTRGAKIRELAGSDADPQKGFQVFQDLARQRAALVREIRDTMRAEQTAQVQDTVTRDIANVDRLAERAKAKFAEFQTDSARLVGGLNRQIGVYGEKLLAPIGSPTDREGSEPARQAALGKLNDLKGARDAFNAEGGRTVENAQKIQVAIEELNKAFEVYARLRGLPAPESLKVEGDKSGMTVRDQMRATEGVGSQLVAGTAGVRDMTAQLSGARAQLDTLDAKVKGLPGALEAMAAAAQAAGPTTQATFESLATSAGRYADQLAAISAQMAAIRAAGPPPIPAAEAAQPIQGNWAGGYPAMKYMSGGGYAGFSPRGSDQVPAMLGREEYVMNQGAANNFLPILKAMNAGMVPSQAGRSSQVTNVGDINVNVSGGATDRQTIDSIAKGLRRGIRRGTISLHK